MKVVLTGASGLLGRSLFQQLSSQGAALQVQAWAFTRCPPPLKKVDIRDGDQVRLALQDFQPDVLVHCAAERRPDVAERDPGAVQLLNVQATRTLAELSNTCGFRMIYISTDYVFDGMAPEGGYDVDARPNPTNLYGRTKLEGEEALLKTITEVGRAVSLRVPVLYGKAERDDESAINVLLEGVRRASKGQKVMMDDWATRFPTLVDDVAKVIHQLARLQGPLPPILHFSSQQQFTKYSIALVFSRILKLPPASTENLIRITDGPKAGETIRPKDCRLSNRALENLKIDTTTVDFETWWKEYLA